MAKLRALFLVLLSCSVSVDSNGENKSTFLMKEALQIESEGDPVAKAVFRLLAREARMRSLFPEASETEDIVFLRALGLAWQQGRRRRLKRSAVEGGTNRVLGLPAGALSDVVDFFQLQRVHVVLDRLNDTYRK